MSDLMEKLCGRRVVASISGGKDSAALSLYLRELGVDHDRVFMDTGWEHPGTYQYLRGELTRVIGPITEIRAEHTMVELIRKKAMFPSRMMRWCTRELKVKPMLRYLGALTDDHVNAVGIRAAESEARSKMGEWEWSKGFDCEVWRPLISWSEQQVIDIHARHGLRPNPLYLDGAKRVGCYPCIMSSKKEIRRIADADPWRIDEIRELEKLVAVDDLVRHEKRVGAPDSAHNKPAFFQAMGAMRAGGVNGSCVPIDEVVNWSRTAHGGKQYELFDAEPGDAGCVRWGLCDTGGDQEVGDDGK